GATSHPPNSTTWGGAPSRADPPVLARGRWGTQRAEDRAQKAERRTRTGEGGVERPTAEWLRRRRGQGAGDELERARRRTGERPECRLLRFCALPSAFCPPMPAPCPRSGSRA